jgi:hypothetical protein
MDGTSKGRLFSAVFTIVVGAAGIAAARSAYAASVTVPTNQFIRVALTSTLTSATAHVGDTFGFATTKDEMLGTLAVPKGTLGHGRLAVVRAAAGREPGALALQADSIDLPDGDTVWVNIDPNGGPHGRFADRHVRPGLSPIGLGYVTSSTGDMVLDAGATFDVVTIPPRTVPAPLWTATPGPVGSPNGIEPMPLVVPMQTPYPQPTPPPASPSPTPTPTLSPTPTPAP